jgi:hypothetical protein
VFRNPQNYFGSWLKEFHPESVPIESVDFSNHLKLHDQQRRCFNRRLGRKDESHV